MTSLFSPRHAGRACRPRNVPSPSGGPSTWISAMRLVAVASLAALVTAVAGTSVAHATLVADASAVTATATTSGDGGGTIHVPPPATVGGMAIVPDGPGNGGSAGSGSDP